MAVSKNNPLTHGASGMLGGVVVFRTWNGKTFMYNRPKKPTKQSELQKDNRNRFRMATSYAKSMMANPEKKAEYKERAKQLNLPNAYTAAIAEYLRKPEIQEIEVVTSSEKIEEIKIAASKKGFDLETVTVSIENQEGRVIEKGEAKKAGGNNWSLKPLSSVTLKGPVRVIAYTKTKYGAVIEKEVLFENRN
jgi:hypothetical protein